MIAAVLTLGGSIGAAVALSGGATSAARHGAAHAAGDTAGSSTTATTGQATATTGASSPVTLVRTANVLPGLSHATALGPLSPSTPLTVDVGLKPADAAAEQSFLRALYTKGNAQYHHFLTPAQYAARFGEPASVVAATRAWLARGGLKVLYVSSDGTLVSARGTVAAIGALMHTTFGAYRVGTVGFIANQVAPAVPSDLPISTVVGLNTLQRMWTKAQIEEIDHPSLSVKSPGSTVKAASGSTSYTGTLVPQDLWSAYDAPASDTGQGETAGMFGAGYPNGVVANLRVYEGRMGLPQVPVRVVSEGTPNDDDLLGAPEWDLDTQAISSMAPGLARLDMYFASTEFDADVAQMISKWAGDPAGPKQMNASFGECESDIFSSAVQQGTLPNPNYGLAVGNQLQLITDSSLIQAVAEGRTLFAASGDTSGSCPLVIVPVLGAGNGVIPQPAALDQGYPCVSQYAVCVGGTVLTTDGTTNPKVTGGPANPAPSRVSEGAWAFTGGGPAANTPEPWYQAPTANVSEPCTFPQTGSPKPDGSFDSIPPGTVCRGVPDVAAMSGSGLTDGIVAGNNAYELNFDMMPFATGGTSLSSPLTVGMWSRIQAASPYDPATRSFPGLGFANILFYQVGNSGSYARDFYDVTQGELPVGNVYQQAGSGWDYTSGWGVLDVAHFMADQDGGTAPTHAVSVTAAPPAGVCSVASMSSIAGNAFDSILEPPIGGFMNDAALDITGASLSLSPDGKSLVATVSGPQLSTTGPPDAIDGYTFYVTWTYNGTTYFAAAAVDQPQQLPATPATNSIGAPVSPPLGMVSYGDGVMDSDNPTFAHSDHGTFTHVGTLSVFTITVPLANVGNPGHGAALQWPYAFDTLPNGVLVPLAVDAATADVPGEQLIAGC